MPYFEEGQVARYPVKDIQPNPFRHIDRYPIRREKVAALRESLRSTGFWANVVARVNGGKPQIAYGHHRLVALREEYGPEHEVELIIRDLSDETMLQIMARENMEEWGTSASIEHETVRAVVDAYAEGKIDLPAPDAATHSQIRYAPSFIPGEGAGAGPAHPYTGVSLARFLGWTTKSGEPQDKVLNALSALEYIQQGILSESDFEGLTTKQAEAVIEQARRAKAEREAAARLHRQQAEQAAREAEAAERQRAEYERLHEQQQREAAAARDQESRRAAQIEVQRLDQERGRAEETRRLAERRQVTEERREREERDRGRHQATVVGRTVSRELRAGRIGYREAPNAAAKVAERRAGPPPYMNDVARRLSADLNGILDVERDDRTKRLEVMIQFRGDLDESIRSDLTRTLEVVAARATGYARRLAAPPETPTVGQLPSKVRD